MRSVSISYEPFGAQVKAHQAPEDIVLLAGGWGSGKTSWLIAEALRNTVLNPGLPGVLVSPTFPLQRRTLYRAIIDFFPEATRWPTGSARASDCLGPLVQDWSSRDRMLTMWNGAQWIFASADDPGSLEGMTLAWGCLDEPRLIRHEAWRIFNSRIRDNRSAQLRRSIAGVPSMGWMFEEFGKPGPNRVMVKARTADNPHLPAGYIESLNLSDKLAQAYLEGEFVVLSGVVFWTYDPAGGSVVDIQPDPSRPTFGALDFGGRRPAFMVIQEVEGLGEVVVEEVCVSDTLEQVFANQCAELLESYSLTMLDCYCDPAGKARNAQTGLSSLQIFESTFRSRGVLAGNLQYSLNPIERHIPNGVEATRARFQDHTGKRHLFVSKHLTETSRTSRYPTGVLGIHGSLLSYRYNQKTNTNIPRKTGEDDHFPDALRYYIVGRHGVMEQPDIAAMNEISAPTAGVRYGGGGFSMEDF
jgi:hypothetical protein